MFGWGCHFHVERYFEVDVVPLMDGIIRYTPFASLLHTWILERFDFDVAGGSDGQLYI